MSTYTKDNISLEEAMSIALCQSFQVWWTNKFCFDCDQPSGNANFIKTTVFKDADGNIQVYNSIDIKGAGSVAYYIDSYDNLNMLRDKFPKLFEAPGTLFAFDK